MTARKANSPKKPELLIRKAEPKDYPAIRRLFLAANSFHTQAMPEFFKPEDARSREMILELIKDSNALLLVAELKGQVIGLLQLFPAEVSKYLWLTDCAIISNLAVAEKFRHLGAGKALMAAAELWAEKKGIKELWLSVWEFNQGAVEFYQKLGYQTARRLMRKQLKTGSGKGQ